ncbi:MAG: PD-(D/E)XK nuclease family protein [Sulfurimonadaceae bacterium]
MDETALVFPTSRSIRDFQQQVSGDSLFLPHTFTMAEFLQKLCIVDGYRYPDEDTRSLLLLEASDFSRFRELQIERNFFTFTKNASYIFKFFEELSAELVPIERLNDADTYAEYEEHIGILVQLYQNYEALCNQKRLLDRIFLPKLYRLNVAFLQTHKKFEIHISGHLTNFEFQVLRQAVAHAKIILVLSTSKFNKKVQKRFGELGLQLQENYLYKIALGTMEILSQEAISHAKDISCEAFSEPLLQAAFVQKKIYDFVAKGYDPQKIAVIVPDEHFASTLKLFDDKSNLNFAMGVPFSQTFFYKKIDGATQALEIDSKENEARLQRVGDTIFQELYAHYYKDISEIDVVGLLEGFALHATEKIEKKIYAEELFLFIRLLPYLEGMNLKGVLHLFMQRLASRTIDDVRGGKITVMGVLETRGVSFEGVIIVDFSDTNVPKKSDKDMFLNTQVRENANLPTMFDRENLQKHYYKSLLGNTQEAAICYVKSPQSSASRFLKELGIEEYNGYKELDYASILFAPSIKHSKEEDEIVLDYSFRDQTISATKLKTFLTCKRKYYYRYIRNLQGHEIPKEMPKEWEIGTHIHAALRNLYTKKRAYGDVVLLKKELSLELDAVCGKSEMEKYLIAMYKKLLDPFCALEIQRFSEGWHVVACEESLETTYAGARLAGQIDRVDKNGDSVLVLDYKSGSYPLYSEKTLGEATDFQLEFYYLLAQKFGSDISCAYYDLKESKIVYEPFLQEKLALLSATLSDMLMQESFEFSKCEEHKHCVFCDYALICKRA